ncbi:hypothetical protein J6S88_04220 [bacterium]|nr:hypothetical protein [bacterium]
MLQDTLVMNMRRLIDFLEYSKNYFIRKSPMKAMSEYIIGCIQEFLTMRKKLKMAQYRLNYHKHQLAKMEQLIAKNNEHTFLKGSKLNETR